jgi:filamentous hemagglutinin family protein
LGYTRVAAITMPMFTRCPKLNGFHLLMVLSKLQLLKHLRLVIPIVFIGLVDTLAHHSALGQIVPDTNWGTENSIVTPNATVQGQPAILIEGGATRHSNLFHSFQTFNIGNGERVYFASPIGVQNILSRVTANTPSSILGVLGVDGSANLFLMNPNGIVFGANASLDVRGSFVATTAHAIQLGNQGSFTASISNAPTLLTVAPSAFLFNQIVSGRIENRSVAPAGVDVAGVSLFGLRVPNGHSLILLGGEVLMDRGRVNAAGGRVELAGIGGAGTVGLTIDKTLFRLSVPDSIIHADVSLSNVADVYVRATGGGSIGITALNFNLSDISSLRAGIPSGIGFVGAQAGNISIDVTEITRLTGGSRITNTVQPGGIGNAGNIDIKTRSFSATTGSLLSSSTFGTGNAGTIQLTAQEVVSLSDFNNSVNTNIFSAVATGAIGNGGDIKITTNVLTLSKGAAISASIFGTGNAGNIEIVAHDQVVLDGVGRNSASTVIENGIATTGNGKGGDISITTGSLLLTNGAALNATNFGIGDAGNIEIAVRNQIYLDGVGRNGFSSGIFSATATTGKGNAGDIGITTGSLLLTNGAALSAITFGIGDAGNIEIAVRNQIYLDGVGRNGFSTGIFNGVARDAVGNAGNITITTGTVSLTDGARLDSLTSGDGDAGNIEIKARDQVALDGVGGRGFSTAIVNRVNSTGNGDAGNIIISANSLSVTNGAEFAASTSGNGDAGNVEITVQDTILMDGVGRNGRPSAIFSSVDRGRGNGGDIRLSAKTVALSNAAEVTATTRSSGLGGNVIVHADRLQLINGGQILTDTVSSGNAGNMILNVSDRILIAGRELNYEERQAQFPNIVGTEGPFSGLFANTDSRSSGTSGTILIQTGDLFVQDGGQISVGSQGKGAAGQMTVTAHSIQLNNQGRLTAETTASSGGNITLDLEAGLLLRRNSLISATAGTAASGGDGGNIRINTPFIVTTALENSDITANAFAGRGGRVEVDTLALFNLVPRSRLDLENLLQTTDPLLLNPQLLPTNDITAISQTNPSLSGDISINTPAVDLTQTVVELPEVPVDVAGLIDQQLCTVAQGSQFVLTGRGGLPDTPTAPPNTRVAMLNTRALWEDWRIEQDSQMNQSSPEIETDVDLQPVESHRSQPIIEAQGWVRTADNVIQLVVASSQTTLLATQFTNPDCSALTGQISTGRDGLSR